MIDQRGEIARVVRGIGPIGRRAQRRKAAMREGHAGIAIPKIRDLLPPAQVIAAEPVRKEKERPAAVHLIIEAAAGPVDKATLHYFDFSSRTVWISTFTVQPSQKI